MKKVLIVIVLLFVICTSFSCKKTHEYNEVYEEDGIQYIDYGKYPQTHISDSKIIAELDKITEVNSLGYYEYDGKEYAKIAATPHNVALRITYSDGSKIRENATEYFLVEPIKWCIISTNDQENELLSEYVLDTQKFQINQYYVEVIDEYIYNGKKTFYANNYERSTIRNYLNNVFLEKAFTSEEQRYIPRSTVDNGKNSNPLASSKYTHENTSDKVYLLCLSDIRNRTDAIKLTAKATDYAIAKGCFCQTENGDYYLNSEYWLRSYYYDWKNALNKCSVRTITITGKESVKMCNVSGCGVRPVLQMIKIKNEKDSNK